MATGFLSTYSLFTYILFSFHDRISATTDRSRDALDERMDGLMGKYLRSRTNVLKWHPRQVSFSEGADDPAISYTHQFVGYTLFSSLTATRWTQLRKCS
ncbi:hypothetical protein BJV74DRAFT_826667, partial [Russula compacta]